MDHKFTLSAFTNRNGKVSWRVAGWLHGIRVRRNFPTREEAAAEKTAWELKSLQTAAGMRPAISSLTDPQLREAEAMFARLNGCPRSLSFYVDFALTNYRAPERERSLADAATDYLAAKQREGREGAISDCQVRSITKELKVLLKHFPGESISALTAQRLTSFCERGQRSLKTVNNRRGILGTFFKFAFQKEWIATNPVERVPRYRLKRKRGSAPTITDAQAQALMAYVETYESGELVPFFALCLFAGIRPCLRQGEILKLRPEHIRLNEGLIIIPPEVSKVHEKRAVTIQPNLAAWLQAYPLEKYPIVPANLQNTRAAVAKKFALTPDVMRHTFISMFVAKFRSMGEAALQAGNSEAIIRKHYLDLKSKDEAERFFSIRPKLRAVPAVAPVVEPSNLPAPLPVAV